MQVDALCKPGVLHTHQRNLRVQGTGLQLQYTQEIERARFILKICNLKRAAVVLDRVDEKGFALQQ